MPEAPLFPVRRHHLEAMTDSVGIMQHAIGRRADPAHGYCTDDVARALQVDLLHQRELGWSAVASRAARNVQFLADAFDPLTGRFRNFRRIDRSWLDGPGSPDSHGRAMLALGEVVEVAPDDRMVSMARSLFECALPAAQELTDLRARGSTLLGWAAVIRHASGGVPTAAFRVVAGDFHERFRVGSDAAWPWPEPIVTYENGLLPRALIVAGRTVGSEPMVATGLAALDWLIEHQVAPAGHLSPIGNGWWPRGGTKSTFDQQPIEATALLLAAEAAFDATSDRRYLTAMELAYAWFLGANDLALEVADPDRGGGRDGLTPRGVNTNQGAESTLMWLIAAEHIRAARRRYPVTARFAGVLVASTA
jgi:hypothetical protein